MFADNFTEYNHPTFGYIKMPVINIDEKQIKRFKLSSNPTPEEYLQKVMIAGLDYKIKKGRIPAEQKEEYLKRANEEYEIICNLGFASYILLVFEILRFCRENDIPNSPSRGSVGGSLVCYLISITQIDPIKHGLLFSRFLSAVRAEKKEINGEIYIKADACPDIDIDSSHLGKPLVKKKIDEMFPNSTAGISNISTLTSKVLIKETLKIVLDWGEEPTKAVSDLIEKSFGKVATIEDSLKNNKKFAKWAADKDEIIEISCKLQDLIRNKSVHAAGVLLCEKAAMDTVPLELDKNNNIVSSYDMEWAQMYGIKVDNLAVATLDVCKDVLKVIGKTFDDIDVNDKSIYDFLCSTDKYYGLFQVSDGVGKQTLNKIQPRNIDNIIDSIALGRPGSIAFVDDYVKNNIDRNKIDPRVLPLLEETRGIVIYQEQIMKLAMLMADFTPLDANGLRKGIGKKIKEIVLSFKEKFKQGSLKNKYSEEFIEWIWGTFEASADYSFNKSHACGYAYLTAISTYLKCNYPKEFFWSCLIHAKDCQNPIEEISKIQMELPHFGVSLLPPHIIKSDLDFTLDKHSIRFGLGQVKGIAEKSIAKLNNFKTEYSNKFEIFEAANESKIPISILSSLILVGALDDELSKESRSKVLLEAQLWNLLTAKEKKIVKEFGKDFNYDLTEIIKHIGKNVNDIKGKPVIKPSRLETLRRDYAPFKEMYDFNKRNEAYASYIFEQKLLGYSYSTKLIDVFINEAPDLIMINRVQEADTNQKVQFVGQVMEVNEWVAKSEKKTRTLKCKIKDEFGMVDVLMFNDSIDEHREENGRQVEVDDIVVVSGRKKEDAVFAWTIGIQPKDVFMKISEMKKIEKTKEDK